MRDPKALLAAERAMGIQKPFGDVCKDLVNVGSLIRQLKSDGVKTVHEVYYEQLATNASYYGTEIYR